jgi:hypothetical protein
VVPIAPKINEPVISLTKNLEAKHVIGEFNRRFVTQISTGLETVFQSPSIGDPKRITEDFIKKCTGFTDAKKILAMKTALNCKSCHTQKENVGLNFPFGLQADLTGAIYGRPEVSLDLEFSDNQVSEKIKTPIAVPQIYIQSGYMPPDNHSKMNPAELGLLEKCLLEEYLGNMLSVDKSKKPGNEPGLVKDLLKNCPRN